LKRLKRISAEGRKLKMPRWRPRSKTVLWVALGVVVLGCGLVVSLALFTGVCQIKAVNFTGNKSLGADYLRQLSGVNNYKNIVTLPVGRIAKNLEENAWVKNARIQRHLLHTVNIKIEERSPVAMLDYSGIGYLVAGDGTVIARAPVEQAPGLPTVHAAGSKVPTTGAVVPDKKVLECVRVIASQPEDTRKLLALGNPFDGRGQVFITRLGFQVIYGHDVESAQKNDVLRAIMIDVANNKRKIAYIDLRVADSPVIKPL
jgi:cell division protein FtsQ